jgi:endoglucanase
VIARGPALRFVAVLGLAAFAACFPARAADNGQACVAVATFPNPELLSAMRRGVNLPGWDNENASSRPTVSQLEALREKGFTHVRLLLEGDRFSGERREAFLDQMYEEIIRLFSLDYAVSLNLHAGSVFERGATEAEADLLGIWRAIAMRVRFLDPEKLAVELLNEPKADSETWWPIARRLAAEIRRILPSNTIVVGPAGPQRHETLAGLEPLDDRNVVYAIHYYDPVAFTHQGADWGSPDDPVQHLRGLPFPASADDPEMKARIADLRAEGHDEAAALVERSLETPWTEDAMKPAFDMMADWSTRHAQPVIVNEFGVLSYHAPRQARLDWLAAVRRQAEQRCLGWAHWDFQDGFGLMDPETGMPDPRIMQALVPSAE